MATGDTNDCTNRVWVTLPPWFPSLSTAPVLNSILTAIGSSFTFCYDYLQFASLQTRIKTATGGWLDLIAWDYFGGRFVRRHNEPDDSWRSRILKELLRPRGTRAALTTVLTDLTGLAPNIAEPWNPQDYGGYGVASMCGYGVAGRYASLQYNNQVFIDCFRPAISGIPNLAGYGIAAGYGSGFGASAYGSLSQVQSVVTDAEIYSNVAQTVAAGCTAWVDIHGGTPSQGVSADHSNAFNSQYIILGYF